MSFQCFTLEKKNVVDVQLVNISVQRVLLAWYVTMRVSIIQSLINQHVLGVIDAFKFAHLALK